MSSKISQLPLEGRVRNMSAKKGGHTSRNIIPLHSSEQEEEHGGEEHGGSHGGKSGEHGGPSTIDEFLEDGNKKAQYVVEHTAKVETVIESYRGLKPASSVEKAQQEVTKSLAPDIAENYLQAEKDEKGQYSAQLLKTTHDNMLTATEAREAVAEFMPKGKIRWNKASREAYVGTHQNKLGQALADQLYTQFTNKYSDDTIVDAKNLYIAMAKEAGVDEETARDRIDGKKTINDVATAFRNMVVREYMPKRIQLYAKKHEEKAEEEHGHAEQAYNKKAA
ncbi:TPA: hypothetical protein HA246_05515 [Candidatus Woesearchaeota archaeon]|nr:hypothetical protein [Candidatus Woesearchaeota archaeon]